MSFKINKKGAVPVSNLIFAGSLVLFMLIFPSFFHGIDSRIHDTWLSLRFKINQANSSLSFLSSLAYNKPISNEIVLAIVDDPTLLNFQELHTGDRSFYANLLDKLKTMNPKMIALDTFFGTPSDIFPEGDDALAYEVRTAKNVVVKSFRRDLTHVTPPYPALGNTDKHSPSYIAKYRGEAYRRVSMLFTNTANELRPSFLTRMYEIYTGSRVINYDKESITFLTKNKEKLRIPLTDDEFMLLNYDNVPTGFNTISVKDILTDHCRKEDIEGKAVIIGTAHSMSNETYYTPTGISVYSPYLNALALRNLLNKNWLTKPNDVLSQVIPIIILGIMIFFVFNVLSPGMSLFISLMSIPILAAISFVELTQHACILNISSSVFAIFSSAVFVTGRKYYAEVSEKLKIKNAFQHYVTASVVNEILKNPDKLNLHGEERVLTVFFSDIEGFTSMAEGMSPLDVVSLLNEYLTEMTDIIFKYDGLLDKYEGDAIMAIFGAPINQTDHAIRACKCAIENQKALAKLRERWKQQKKPLLKARIGINTGNVVVGNMGSAMRFDYTVIGDNVNVAARLETANKIFGTEIMVSEETAKLAEDYVISRKIAALKAVGKSNLINIYEVLADKSDSDKTLVAKAKEAKRVYEEALLQLENRNFKEAEIILKDYSSTHPEDNPASVLLQRIQGFLVVPPPVGLEIAIAQEIK